VGQELWVSSALWLLITSPHFLPRPPSHGHAITRANTQLALFGNHIDVALTYERDQEMLAASEGWSNTAGCVFHNHFVLAGPASDPAGVRFTRCLADALRRIASQRSLFHNRADASATMWKESSLWLEARLRPWEDVTVDDWYRSSLLALQMR
jgi:tungstate transport system substrate-binding protein